MFKSIFSALVLIMVIGCASASAQMSDRLVSQPSRTKSVANDALETTREMTNRLHLNEAQFVKLLPVNRTKISSANGINHQYKNDDATRLQKLTELEAQYEQECSRILTPTQLSQLQHEQPATTPIGTGNGLG